MFKNKEVRKLFLIEFIIILLGIITIIILNNYMFNCYRKEIIINNTHIVNELIKKYPEEEDLIISSLINHDITYDESLKILKKYSLEDSSIIDYLGNNNQIKKDLIKINIITITIYLIIIFTIFIIFIKRIYKKIGTLSTYTNEILNNRYNMDIREYEEGDISNLKNDLYKMTIKLKEQNEISLKDKQYLSDTLSDISHQLKTPLTGMYVINEILYDNQIDKSLRKELLIKNKNQLERIEWLVNSLLKMSRIDSQAETLNRKDTKIIDLLNLAISPLKIPIELKEITLSIKCDKSITANIDLEWTKEAILNIIKNACEHTDKGGHIEIICTENPIYTEINIKDNGCGIKKEDIGHIFERFYKGSSSKDSIGIGLNMSKKIIDMQDGEITVSSTLHKGSTFTVRFYKNVI